MSEVDGNGLVGDDHTLEHTVQLSIDAIEDGNDYLADSEIKMSVILICNVI